MIRVRVMLKNIKVEVEGLKGDMEELHRIRDHFMGEMKNLECKVLMRWDTITDILDNLIKDKKEVGYARVPEGPESGPVSAS